MKKTTLLLAVLALCICAWAASDATIAPSSAKPVAPKAAASHKPQAASYGAEAITVPQMLSYQGKLTDTFGLPVSDTVYAIRFRLYAQATGGTQFWEENQQVRTSGGLFSTLLGSVTPIGSVPDAGALHLGMAVGGGPELTPRVRIVSAAYAYKADTANFALAGAGGGDGAWVRGSPDSVLFTVNYLGIARGGAQNNLYGSLRYTHTNLGNECVTGQSGQNYTCATVGGGGLNSAENAISTVAGGFENHAYGYGAAIGGGLENAVYGRYGTIAGGNIGSVAAAYGGALSGYSNVAGFTSVDTAATIAGGYANKALSSCSFVGGGRDNMASGDYSVIGGGRGDSVSARYGGVLSGYHNVAGDAATDTGATVAGGYDNAVIGAYAFGGGGRGNSASAAYSTFGGGYGNGVSGIVATVGGGYSNLASGNHSTVCGGNGNIAGAQYATVAGGYSNASYGYASFTTGSGSNAGYSNSAAFNGQTATASDQTRVGVLSKASGTFTIDHPLDPQGKILNHYFIEGPEMRNIYDGEAVLDASGRATVLLPDYFNALNRNPRVQLTGVGSADVVYLAEKVSGNQFVIGGKPGMEVYWQVTGERKDVSAEATRRMMPVEQPKTGPLAGRMLDDDFLAGCMDQLVREGKAQGIDFRTAAGRAKYEKMKQAVEQR